MLMDSKYIKIGVFGDEDFKSKIKINLKLYFLELDTCV